MSDRTETLLSELVELHRRQVGLAEQMLVGQKEALAGQKEALETQKLAVERQKIALSRQRGGLRLVFVLIAIVLAMIIIPYAYSWFRFLGMR